MPSPSGRWVALDVVASALGVSKNEARAIAKREGVRTTATRPAQYHFDDVIRLYNRRKASK